MKSWIHQSTPLGEVGGELLIVPCFSNDLEGEATASFAEITNLTGPSLVAQARSEAFTGRNGATMVRFIGGELAASTVMLLGLGSREGFTVETLKEALTAAFTRVKALKLGNVAVDARPVLGLGVEPYSLGQMVAASAGIISHTVKHYKTRPSADFEGEFPLTRLDLVTDPDQWQEARRGITDGRSIAHGINFTRDLVQTPAGDLTPMALLRISKAIVRNSRGLITGKYFYGKRLKEMGANALLAVGQGSAEPEVLIELEYTPRSGPTATTLGLIGKSVTFDSGGLDLKPADGMRNMKRDMSGGATVLGALIAISRLELPVSVKVVLAATENMTGSRAYKPGDVLRTMSGLTVEVDNTDAEGRLTLADALTYIQRSGVTHMVDFATLTGAVISIGGDVGAACFSNNPSFANLVVESAECQGELMVNMPMWNQLRRLNESEIADVKNSGGRKAGSTTAAWFLREFAGEDIPWAHIDIAGVAYRDRELDGVPKGPSGYGVRTAVAVAAQLAAQS